MYTCPITYCFTNKYASKFGGVIRVRGGIYKKCKNKNIMYWASLTKTKESISPAISWERKKTRNVAGKYSENPLVESQFWAKKIIPKLQTEWRAIWQIIIQKSCSKSKWQTIICISQPVFSFDAPIWIQYRSEFIYHIYPFEH